LPTYIRHQSWKFLPLPERKLMLPAELYPDGREAML